MLPRFVVVCPRHIVGLSPLQSYRGMQEVPTQNRTSLSNADLFSAARLNPVFQGKPLHFVPHSFP